MGWWHVQGTKDMVGDIPLDALGDAVRIVLKEYRAAFGRRPTKAEWEALLRIKLGARVGDDAPIENEKVARVVIALERSQ